MISNIGKKYAGLTDLPLHRKMLHGDPPDWSVCRFDNEEEAQVWYRLMLIRGYIGGTGGVEWRYGYTFTCTHSTKE